MGSSGAFRVERALIRGCVKPQLSDSHSHSLPAEAGSHACHTPAGYEERTGGYMRAHITTAAAALLTCSLALSAQQPPAAGAPPGGAQAGGGRGQQGPQV